MGLNQDTTKVEFIRKLMDKSKKELLELYYKLEEERVFKLSKEELEDEIEGYFDDVDELIEEETTDTIKEMYLGEDYNYKLDYSEDELREEILGYGLDKIMEEE